MPDLAALAARNQVEHNLAYAEALGGRVARTEDAVAVDVAARVAFLDACVPVRPVDPAAVADLAGRFFGARAHTVADFFGTLDLTPYGYQRTGTMPVMAREPAPVAVETSLAIERVVDVAGLAAFEQVMVEGMGIAAYAGAPAGSLWAPAVLERGTVRFHLGRLAGRPVACAAAVVLDECVGIYAVATLAAERRRGHGAALTAAALADAPARPAVLTSSDLGRGVYERLGFVVVAHRTGWRTE